MRNKFIILLTVFAFISLKAQDTYTLQEAVDFALQNTSAIKNAELAIDAAKHKKWETTTIGLPQISASVDYQNFLEQPVSLIPAKLFEPMAPDDAFAEISFGTKQNMNASATLSQLLFDGSYLVGLQSAKVYLKISELAKVKTKQAIKEAVIDAYGNVLLAKEGVLIIENNLKLLDKTIHDTNEIYKNGFAEEQDVEQLQITRENLNNQLNKTKRLLVVGKNMLKIVMGIDIDKPITLTDDLEKLSTIDLGLSTTDFNVENHIDYQISKNSVRAKELFVKLEKSKYLPQLVAFLNYGTKANSEQFNFLNSEQRWFASSLFGVSLNVPIFSSFKRNARVQQAKIALKQENNNLSQEAQKLKLAVENAKANYQYAMDNFNTSKKNLALAKRIEKKEQIKFFEGVSTSFNLTQAQNQLYSTQQDYLQAIVQIISTKAKLETALDK